VLVVSSYASAAVDPQSAAMVPAVVHQTASNMVACAVLVLRKDSLKLCRQLQGNAGFTVCSLQCSTA
jgi:hypothetical protein